MLDKCHIFRLKLMKLHQWIALETLYFSPFGCWPIGWSGRPQIHETRPRYWGAGRGFHLFAAHCSAGSVCTQKILGRAFNALSDGIIIHHFPIIHSMIFRVESNEWPKQKRRKMQIKLFKWMNVVKRRNIGERKPRRMLNNLAGLINRIQLNGGPSVAILIVCTIFGFNEPCAKFIRRQWMNKSGRFHSSESNLN